MFSLVVSINSAVVSFFPNDVSLPLMKLNTVKDYNKEDTTGIHSFREKHYYFPQPAEGSVPLI